MKKQYQTSLFIFRRDLRLIDNSALNSALEQSDTVIPCFIFDPEQVTDKNDYYSAHAVQCMIESLQSIDAQLKEHNSNLYLFYGSPEKIIKQIAHEIKIDAVFVNTDYTPFSIKRDVAIKKTCDHEKIEFHSCADLLLNEPNTVAKKDGKPYLVFTAFYNKARTIPVRKPKNNHVPVMFNGTIKCAEKRTIYKTILADHNKNIAVNGGRENGLKILHNLIELQDYTNTRDIPSLDTSHLSAHLKFGTLSVREIYWAIVEKLGSHHPLLRQLYWRDFFTHIAFHFPTVFGNAFHKKYNALSWHNSSKLFDAWCTGTTGFPIVDAGMRQLNKTGFMHNRVRMIVASFLTKDLHISWLKGERYFAEQLVDYDPAVNNGNWQWCASTGCDAQPYFRIFNPWLQQKKFDPECDYIKKWIPELKNQEPAIIHSWFKDKNPAINGYPRPIVDHSKESVIAKMMYKQL